MTQPSKENQAIRQVASTAVELAVERAGGRKELAEAASISVRSVYRYLSGETLPSPENARAISESTNVGLDRLRPDIWGESL